MRSIALAVALAFAPLATAGACASFEQVTPKSPRAALAEAETAIIGIANIAATLRANGVISVADAGKVFTELMTASETLNTAHALLKAGDTVAASRTVSELLAALNALSLQLSQAGEQ